MNTQDSIFQKRDALVVALARKLTGSVTITVTDEVAALEKALRGDFNHPHAFKPDSPEDVLVETPTEVSPAHGLDPEATLNAIRCAIQTSRVNSGGKIPVEVKDAYVGMLREQLGKLGQTGDGKLKGSICNTIKSLNTES